MKWPPRIVRWRCASARSCSPAPVPSRSPRWRHCSSLSSAPLRLEGIDCPLLASLRRRTPSSPDVPCNSLRATSGGAACGSPDRRPWRGGRGSSCSRCHSRTAASCMSARTCPPRPRPCLSRRSCPGRPRRSAVRFASAPPRRPSPGEDEIVIPLPLWAQMGRGALGETDRIMASPIAPRGYRPPLGTYRLVVPGGGPLDLTGGAPAHAEDVVAISGPSALRVGKSLPGGVAATTPSGRHFLGRVLLDEAGSYDAVRRRIRVGEPIRSPGLSEALPREESGTTAGDPPSMALRRASPGASGDLVAGTRLAATPLPPLAEPPQRKLPAPTAGRPTASDQLRAAAF